MKSKPQTLEQRPHYGKQDLKKKIWARDNYTCTYCGLNMRDFYIAWQNKEIKRKTALLTVDHIVPRQAKIPKDWSEENLTTACFKCNQKKGGRNENP